MVPAELAMELDIFAELEEDVAKVAVFKVGETEVDDTGTEEEMAND